MSYIYGVDVSWPNGNYWPGSEAFVIVGAVSLDGGSPFVQRTYRQQVANARAAGKAVGHYAFNGRTNRMSPAAFADYFVNNLYDYRIGDVLVLDVESSEGGDYRAWNPSEAREFRDRVQSRIATRLGIYGNRSDMGAPGWGALKATGSWLWIAWPGDESRLASIGEWGSDWSIWQYSSAGNLDRNYAKVPLAQLAGVPAAPIISGENMFLVHSADNPSQYVAVSFDGGEFRARYLEDPFERAVVLAMSPALPVTLCDGPTFDGFLARVGYKYGAPIPPLQVAADVVLDDATVQKIAAQVQPADAEAIAQRTADKISPAIQTIKVPTKGVLNLS